MAGRRRLWGLVLAGGLAGGCHVPLAEPPAAPTAVHLDLDLPAVTPGRIEPDPASLPRIDADAVDPAQLTAAAGAFRALTEPDVRKLAAAHSAVANLLDAENDRPTAPAPEWGDCQAGMEALREARFYAAR